jgi:diacylglycerol kinase family enzyme
LKTLSLVLNAHSGTTRELGRDKVLDAVTRSADWARVIVHDCEDGFEDCISQACAAASDYIAVAGGDGTAAAVLNELVRTRCKTPVIALPLGDGEPSAQTALWRPFHRDHSERSA